MSDLEHVTHGVWRRPEDVRELPDWVRAVLTACPPNSVVAGVPAARLHGLWLPPDLIRPIEIIVHPETPMPSQRPGVGRRGVRMRRRILAPDEITELDGILITTQSRTWLELAGELGLADLVAAGDCALRGTATPASLAQVVQRARHCPGVVNARAALPLLNARSRSRPESHLRYAIVSRGLPTPAVNEPIFSGHGEWLAEPDLSYDDVKLALEYNGAEHAKPGRMRRDITRDLDVDQRGRWRSVTFGPAEVFGRPDEVALIVRRLRWERAQLGCRAG